ncbi:hypothetical protein [Paractinoplanes brasiliensis]|uniref:Uncharacterized protein n=1 Tax=Paractinoplanes brasiliensis TaxID=52695 RepID=A0A4R6JKN6_9ACTN|nr:hypothetical protein [Actinoplanes brasiliensis]TDO36649.1 hypothetical protein C8E87_0230 [Actinoplanes brasiliensis]GID32287.1 hypothetical protein Abr02nite_72700 [Actinoplanes brasiliensis]
MTEHFDPNIPPAGETDPCIEGDFVGPVVVLEKPALGKGNLVIDRTKPFDIKVKWHVFGNLVPLWLTALSKETDKWIVTAYVESQGPGTEKALAKAEVALGGPRFTLDEYYEATITVPAGTLDSSFSSSETESGVYKIVVTAFLDSKISSVVNFDVLGSIEGPIIKVEEPELAAKA